MKNKLLTFISMGLWQCLVCSEQPSTGFPDPVLPLPAIPPFWFYNGLNMTVWTFMGLKEANKEIKCEKEEVAAVLDPESGYDYKITKETTKNGKRADSYEGYIAGLNKEHTLKDRHVVLYVTRGSEQQKARTDEEEPTEVIVENQLEVFSREYLLSVSQSAICGVFFVVTEPEQKETKNKGRCVLKVKKEVGALIPQWKYLQCRPILQKCINNNGCDVSNIYIPGAPPCHPEIYPCSPTS